MKESAKEKKVKNIVEADEGISDEETLAELNKVVIYIGCRDLPNMDIGSLTDPCVRVYIRETRIPELDWKLLGETET